MATQIYCDNPENQIVVADEDQRNNIIVEDNETKVIIAEIETVIIGDRCATQSGSGGSGNVREYIVDPMTPNQLTYSLPEIPKDGKIIPSINGVTVNYTLIGVNFTITNYPQGDIAAADSLKVTYFI